MAEKKNIQPAVRNLAAGDVLFREGEVGDYAYQIVKGKIEVCKSVSYTHLRAHET